MQIHGVLIKQGTRLVISCGDSYIYRTSEIGAVSMHLLVQAELIILYKKKAPLLWLSNGPPNFRKKDIKRENKIVIKNQNLEFGRGYNKSLQVSS